MKWGGLPWVTPGRIARCWVDGVTGIWVSRRLATGWADPVCVSLYRGDCLDGCQVVVGEHMWFASVRPGNLGEIDVYTARRKGDH